MSTRLMLTTLAILALAACNTPGDRRSGMVFTPPTDAGSGSGVAPGRLVSSLSAAEASSLCDYVAALTAGPEVSCDGGFAFGPVSSSECVTSVGSPPSGCAATVGDVEACFEGADANPCAAFTSPACAPVLACATST